MTFVALHVPLILGVKVLHISLCAVITYTYTLVWFIGK